MVQHGQRTDLIGVSGSYLTVLQSDFRNSFHTQFLSLDIGFYFLSSGTCSSFLFPSLGQTQANHATLATTSPVVARGKHELLSLHHFSTTQDMIPEPLTESRDDFSGWSDWQLEPQAQDRQYLHDLIPFPWLLHLARCSWCLGRGENQATA